MRRRKHKKKKKKKENILLAYFGHVFRTLFFPLFFFFFLFLFFFLELFYAWTMNSVIGGKLEEESGEKERKKYI